MRKSKLILLLKSFSPEELKTFKEFLLSPYFNKSKTLSRLYAELRKHYPDFNSDNIEKKVIYRKIFPGKKYNEQVMKNMISELIKLTKEFLIVEYNRKENYDDKINLLRQMILRKTDPVFFSELKSFETDLKQVSEISERNFYYLFQIEEAKISFHLERNQQPLVFEKVLHSGEYLILFFLLHLTKTISNINANKQSFNAIYETNLPEIFFNSLDLEKVIGYMNEHKVPYAYVAELYYYRVRCNSHPHEEAYYYKFKNLLFESIKLLNRIELYGLFSALETFCLSKINSGKSKFVDELFDVFNKEIEFGFYKFSDSSPLTYMKFRNTYLSALSIKKYEWAENFIMVYKNDLIESDRENIYKIAVAQLDFEKGDYEKVLKMLSDIKSDLVYIKIDIRNLTIMSYHELNYTESVLSSIDSFRHFLSKNKSLSTLFKESHLRFVNSLNSYILYKSKDKNEKLIELKEKLLPYTTERRIKWLVEKINLDTQTKFNSSAV